MVSNSFGVLKGSSYTNSVLAPMNGVVLQCYGSRYSCGTKPVCDSKIGCNTKQIMVANRAVVPNRFVAANRVVDQICMW